MFISTGMAAIDRVQKEEWKDTTKLAMNLSRGLWI